MIPAIGSALPRPTEFRHLSTWFGLDDLMQFTMRCIEAGPDGLEMIAFGGAPAGGRDLELVQGWWSD